MKKQLCLTIILVVLSPASWGLFFLNPTGALSMGNTSMDEVISGTSYEHSALAFGAEAGLRAGVNLGPLFFGGTGTYSWKHAESERTDPNAPVSGTKRYDNTFRELFLGAVLGISIPGPGLKIWGEYYPVIDGTLHYAAPDDENPFSKNDKLSGSGFGVGIGIDTGLVFAVILGRSYKYDEWKTNTGIKRDLPSSVYSEMDNVSLVFQVGLWL